MKCLQITFTFSLQVLIVAEESSVKRVISGGEQVDVGQGQQQEEHSNQFQEGLCKNGSQFHARHLELLSMIH